MASQLMDQINDLAIRARSAALFTDMDVKQLEREFTAGEFAPGGGWEVLIARKAVLA